MRALDFSSFQGVVLTLVGLVFVTLIGVSVRLLMMTTVQQRRERRNRQINERLRTLIAAYRVLGGSFTGDLSVDPTHLRVVRKGSAADEPASEIATGSDRSRRIRDNVEGALSDVLLLGNEQHVRLAEHAARGLVAGRPIHTQELVVSLRDFIRKALDLDSLPSDILVPPQGPTLSAPSDGRGKADQDRRESEGGGSKGGGMDIAGLGGGTGTGFGVEDERHQNES